MAPLSIPESLSLIAAPMVNQSDLPFRLLTRKHGATLAYTQMLSPERLVHDREYLQFHLRDLEGSSSACCSGLGRPVVVQLCGNDPDGIVRGARLVEGLCDGIGSLYIYENYIMMMMENYAKGYRFKLGMSSRTCAKRSLWSLPLGTKRLAFG